MNARARRLKILRQYQKMTQEAFANSLGISKPLLCKLEAGNSPVQDKHVNDVSRIYSIDPKWLNGEYGEDEKPEPLLNERSKAQLDAKRKYTFYEYMKEHFTEDVIPLTVVFESILQMVDSKAIGEEYLAEYTGFLQELFPKLELICKMKARSYALPDDDSNDSAAVEELADALKEIIIRNMTGKNVSEKETSQDTADNAADSNTKKPEKSDSKKEEEA